MNRFLLLFLLSSLIYYPSRLSAQANPADSSLVIPMFYATYCFQLPGADMADRFGFNSDIGGGFKIKTRNNWIFGAEYNYLFGNNVKNQDSILNLVSTSSGYIIDGNGAYATVYFYERGFYINAHFGRIFHLLNPNPNSGITISAGIGLLQHKIRIENPGQTAPQISGDYVKGYDKLSNGIAISEFIGYTYFGNRRLISFYAGFDFTQAWTSSRRDFDFTLMKKDEQKRFEVLYGFRVGWIIPLYKRRPAGYYFN